MRIRGIDCIRRGIRRFSNLLRNRVIILLYHRVAEIHPDPQLLCVTQANFAEHMEHLQQNYQPISLHELKRSLAIGDIHHRSVVVTFDDGYADNFWNAKPILEHYNVPATFFVTSGYIDSNQEFFSDELERLLLHQENLPDSISLTIEGKTYSWQLDGFIPNLSNWDVTMNFYPTSRHRCYHEIHKLLRPLNNNIRQQALSTLAKILSSPNYTRPERRALLTEEVRALSNHELIEVGSHGIYHLVLGKQPLNQQWEEINESKLYLEKLLGRSIISFAYPYGGTGDVSKETICLVQKAGYSLACSNVCGPVINNSNIFWLPRFLVRNWNEKVFSEQLKGAFYG